ncbi:trypsin-like peptidase domain-containing protein [Tenacibaculum finnmarkense]|uniref:trypsin-like peptidase domain-containing protein n=1 Tax=Tenacibaculum finnmarkense TaxID=2781243 RepID=UPI001E3D26A6|nr:trypsin-like peptidase domain-containing protein [Tenacibaculum finnmarkense]MCD8421708.1 trypsin-like peptidase domain-containing protein [Tenacibaculum finnmarkense genomovar ulcerans]MCG8237834.1 trypsin-like peptidase domain-containing protein [Tenacibaculum finnmarkense genomovar ulcerans]
MKNTVLLLFISLFVSQITFSQQEKVYYNSEWKVTNKSKAKFYRLITFDEKGKPKGKVKDYFMNGNLQWEGYLSYADKYENSKDSIEGVSIWYYDNGNKSMQTNTVDGKLEGREYYHKNGNISGRSNFKNGKLEGDTFSYYESGKIKRKYKYVNGQMTSKFFIECDEYNRCERIFSERFYWVENVYKWPLHSVDSKYKSKIIESEGLLMETNTENGYTEFNSIFLDLENNFSIETIIDFKNGNENSGHGIIWGFKDWDSYSYFYISPNGYYTIGGKSEGINVELAEWTLSIKINKGNARNQLKIFRVDDKMYFTINGEIIYSSDFYSFRGTKIGLSIMSGKKKILFENLIIKQDTDEVLETKNIVANEDEWKGNGTGFFIDRKGYIATNYHVVKNANEIEIEITRNGVKQLYKAEIIKSDKQNDISIIKIVSSDFKFFSKLPYNFKTNISDVGSNVFALGYPLLSLMGNEIKFTDGKISSKTGIQGDITSYQISVPIQPGNSGGPLFDFDGNLVGITSSGINRKLDLTENVNYAIKSSYLKNLIDVLDYKISLPNDETIRTLTLTEKIKSLSNYVVLIKVK